MSGLELRTIRAEESAPLRREVLRAGLAHPPLGDGSGAHHVGVYDDAELVATGNIRPEPAPWRGQDRVGLRDGAGDWRVRGMATVPRARGRGAGRTVLDALVAYAVAHDGALVWCNARTTAEEFYARAGWRTIGEPWDEPGIGPHVRMWIAV